MPVVPFREQDRPAGPPMPPLDRKYLFMAASAMHAEGRLIKSDSEPYIPTTVQERDLPPPPEPQLYPPSNGQRNGPSMMT